MKIKNWILILVLVVALGLAGCTRSASESPTAVPGSEETPAGEQQPPSNLETAVAGGGFATQTAEAANPGQGEQQGQTPESPTEPPAAEEATPVPAATEPEGAAEPTTVPATEAPAVTGGSCTSPYTVQSGEWIWSIGRKCNISPQAIIDANNLACYYDLAGRLQCPVYAGTKLTLPANAPPFVGP